MVCMLALGETLPKASSHRGVERKSGFQVLVVLLGLRRERVEVFYVPFVLDYDVLVSSLVVTKECYLTLTMRAMYTLK